MSTRASASERAYQHVKRRVLRGGYDGGDLITEGQVAEALGISRTPVREAFLRLEVEGLLRLFPKRGALVVPVSAREIEEVVEARLIFERFAATKVIATGSHWGVAETMQAILQRQQLAAEQGHADRFSDLDRDFHAALIAAADNAIVSQQYDLLRDRQVRMKITALLREPGRFDEILSEHRRLCALLGDGDIDGVCDLLGKHVSRTGQVVANRG